MKPFSLAFLFFIAFSNVFAQTDAAKNLHALFDAEWQWTLENSPTFASYLGDKRYNNRWNDQSLDAIKRRNARRVEALAKLKQINRAELSEKDKVNYDLFEKDYESAIANFETRLYLLPINQRGGVQTSDELAEFIQFQTVKDYEDWIARLDAFPVLMEQNLALMQAGKAEKMIWSRQVLTRVPAQLDKQIVQTMEQSPFYAPFNQMSKDVSEAEQTRLKNLAKTAIQTKVIPSYKKLKDYFEREYLPAAYPEAGIWQMNGGDKIYEFLARDYTTTNLTPKEIHEKGLSEVARIRFEMEKIKTQVGFKGTLQEFFQHLRSDPKFFYKMPDELLNAYRAMTRRIDPELVKVFRTLPRTPYGVIPIPDKIAPDTTTAYYNSPAANGSRPGYYYVNLYKPETRPKWEMMALSIHEAVPGHHLQLALQQELGEVPNFRKFGGYTAFIEGWGLYSEYLGEEMGLYSDPYDKFGQLTYEMWRAVRLVVDTGMHYFKWDRQRAIDFFKANAAKTEQDIVNEIDRYISDPGQALAYKIGELKIKELRQKSKTELGAKFDVKEFHDVVLLSGAVPLDVLEKNINEWIRKIK
jgi:prolyl oligopeptidase